MQAALLSALKMLKRQDLTIQEVKTRLECKFESSLVNQTILFLTENRLLDDLRYARNVIERNEGRRAIGDQALKDKLESRGVPAKVIHDLMLDCDQDELNRALILIESKFSGSNSPGRVARFLFSRGFSEDTIETILERVSVD